MTTTNEARFEITTKCNYKCNICPLNNGGFERRKETMPTDLFTFLLKKIKKEGPQITEITLSGMGEPFLDINLLNKFDIAKHNGYNVYALTNGSKANKEKLEYLFKNGLKSIRFSLHTLDEEYYDEMTGTKNNFSIALENIEHAIRLKEKYNTEIIISSDISNDTYGDVGKIREKFENRVDLIEIWRPHNWVNWARWREGERTKMTCGRPWNGPVQIQVDGTINMCCFDYNGELLLGDFKTQSLKEIFNSDMYKKIVKAHENSEYMDRSDLICKNCDQLYQSDESIVLYNNKFKPRNRIGKVSTTYKGMI